MLRALPGHHRLARRRPHRAGERGLARRLPRRRRTRATGARGRRGTDRGPGRRRTADARSRGDHRGGPARGATGPGPELGASRRGGHRPGRDGGRRRRRRPIEASGAAGGLGAAIRATTRGGRIVMLGLLPPGDQPVAVSLAISRELELVGSFRFNDEIDAVIAALADGSLDVDGVVTRVRRRARPGGARDRAGPADRQGTCCGWRLIRRASVPAPGRQDVPTGGDDARGPSPPDGPPGGRRTLRGPSGRPS